MNNKKEKNENITEEQKGRMRERQRKKIDNYK